MFQKVAEVARVRSGYKQIAFFLEHPVYLDDDR